MAAILLGSTLERSAMTAPTSFAAGVMPSTTGTLLQVDKPARIQSINLINTNAADQTVLVYVKRLGDTQRLYARSVLSQWERADPIGNPLDLSPGDQIRAVTTTPNAVDYFVSGEAT